MSADRISPSYPRQHPQPQPQPVGAEHFFAVLLVHTFTPLNSWPQSSAPQSGQVIEAFSLSFIDNEISNCREHFLHWNAYTGIFHTPFILHMPAAHVIMYSQFTILVLETF